MVLKETSLFAHKNLRSFKQPLFTKKHNNNNNNNNNNSLSYVNTIDVKRIKMGYIFETLCVLLHKIKGKFKTSERSFHT